MLFSVENPHDGKTFENYTRFEWGVEVGMVTTFMLRLFVPHEFDMLKSRLPPPPSQAINNATDCSLSTFEVKCTIFFMYRYVKEKLV